MPHHVEVEPRRAIVLLTFPSGCFLDAAHLQCDKEDVFLRHKGTFRDRIVGQLYDSPVYGGSAKFGLPRMIDGMTKPIANPSLRKVGTREGGDREKMVSYRVVVIYDLCSTGGAGSG